MTTDSLLNQTVAEIVAHNYKAADVFKKYQIDFCCGGNVSLSELCAKKSLDFSEIAKDLQTLDDKVSRSHNFNAWELDFLVDYIINVHHSYVLENLPLISQYADKVAKVHGHHRGETLEINNLFKEVAEELRAHMLKEEKVLFPFIKKLLAAKKQGSSQLQSPLVSIEEPINMMEAEHERAGEAFRNIASLSNQYSPPPEACNTYRVLYAKLQEFEEDLHQHVHLENNILFPKALQLAESPR